MTLPSKLTKILKNAKHIVAMTGAGVSAESGVPTFRDAQTGLWANYEPTELATPQAFERDPKLVWDWYQWRKEKVENVKPNAGHFALVQMESLVPQFTLITQNVDGLHQQAGASNVLELHGNIMRAKCSQNNHIATEWPNDSLRQPPLCEECGGLMRPDVVWFNEGLPRETLQSASTAAATCNVFFSIGTSSVVHPAAALAVSAVQQGAVVVEINPNETPLTCHATFSLTGPSEEILPEIVSTMKGYSDGV